MADRRFTEIRRILLTVLWLNVGVALAKLTYGIITQSLGMQADGFHSLFDGISNIIGLIGIAFASQPADHLHPYGHKKFETFASAGIAIMLIGTCGYVGWRGLSNLAHPTPPLVTPVSFGIMLVTMMINGAVSYWERTKGKAFQSEVLTADSYHTASDLLTSFSVLCGLVAVRLGYPWADSIIALIIAGVIAWTAMTIFREVTHSLSDHIRYSPNDIRSTVLTVPGVVDSHEIRTRGLANHVFVDLSIHVQSGIPIEEAHTIAHKVEETLKSHFDGIEDVVVHIEPDGHHQTEHQNTKQS